MVMHLSEPCEILLLVSRYAREDALGKLGGAVAEGAQLIEDLYQAFYLELQKPLSTEEAGAKQTADGSTHGQTSQGAHEPHKSEAAAKVIRGCCIAPQASFTFRSYHQTFIT